jgi:hypothetical protein
MKPFLLSLVSLSSLAVVCLAGTFHTPRECYEMAKAPQLRELPSATNLPPEVLQAAGASGLSWTIPDYGPGYPTPAKSWRLLWAVTDERCYVVHTETVPSEHPNASPYYRIVVATPPKTNGAPLALHGGPSKLYKDYRTYFNQLKDPLWAGNDWWFMTNRARLRDTANFHEIHSCTNLPPAVLESAISHLPRLEVRVGEGRIQGSDHGKMADPGQPWSTARLIWAATDNTNWIVHCEFRASPTSAGGTHYYIFGVSPPDVSCGYYAHDRRFKDYKDYIEWTSEPHFEDGEGF